MKILVCGGRDYRKKEKVFQTLDLFYAVYSPKVTVVVHGDAPGADRLGKEWAVSRGLEERGYPANWDDLSQPDAVIKKSKYGKEYDARAGHRRNQKMLDDEKPEVVIAFPGGPGTNDMKRLTKKYGIKLLEID